MQTKVTFYLLDNIVEQKSHTNNALIQSSLFCCACEQAAYYYRQQQKVFIYTIDQNQAHDVDEILWSFEADSFVPHNLMGEGPSYGSPVEISWQAPTNRRAVLINLTNTAPNFATQFRQIIDFVPTEEGLKQQARSRYRQYQQLGFSVEMNQTVK